MDEGFEGAEDDKQQEITSRGEEIISWRAVQSDIISAQVL